MTGDDPHATDYDFAGKYEESNPIARLLLDGFYGGVAALLRQARAREALEVGCGEGFSTARVRDLLPADVTLRAVDVEQRLVEAARRRNPAVPVEQASIYGLPDADASVDLVICMEVLEHLDRPADALRELARVSARWLLLTVPREPIWRGLNLARGKYPRDLGNTPGHLQHWSSRGFVRLVSCVATPVAVRRPLPWTQVLASVAHGHGGR